MPVIQFRPAPNRPHHDAPTGLARLDQIRLSAQRSNVVPMRRTVAPLRDADISYADLVKTPGALSRLSTLIRA